MNHIMSNKTNTNIPQDILPCISSAELRALNLKKADTVQLTNGKLYKVVNYNVKNNRILLYSKEYDKKFFADHKIVHKKVELSKPKKK